MVFVAQYRPVLESFGLTTVGQVRQFRGEIVQDHHGRRDILRIVAANPDGGALVLFLKRVWRPHKKDGLASLLRRGKVWSCCRQEWENCRALQDAGLRTAELVAYGEECLPLWEKFSFIVTRAADGKFTVEEFVRDCRDLPLRRKVFDALAKEIRRLHDAGLATPDLFTRHVFVDTAGSEPRFCFIDMARLDRYRRTPDRVRARDLAELNVTAPLRFVSVRERVRFLRTYAGRVDRRLARLVRRRATRLLKRRKFQDFFATGCVKAN